MGTTHLTGLNLKFAFIADAAAGEFEVSGIEAEDTLLAVVGFKITLGEAAPPTMAYTVIDLTSEFTITGADAIDNTGGTSLADIAALVVWLDQDAS